MPFSVLEFDLVLEVEFALENEVDVDVDVDAAVVALISSGPRGSGRGPRSCEGRAHLKDQGQRASDSVVCNIAEGASKRGTAAGRNNLRIALGEAGECCAVLDLVRISGAAEQQQKLRRIGAMLHRLAR